MNEASFVFRFGGDECKMEGGDGAVALRLSEFKAGDFGFANPVVSINRYKTSNRVMTLKRAGHLINSVDFFSEVLELCAYLF